MSPTVRLTDAARDGSAGIDLLVTNIGQLCTLDVPAADARGPRRRADMGLLGEVPAAFHAGVQDILLIAFGLAWAEFLGTGSAPIGIDVEGHGRDEEIAGARSGHRQASFSSRST